MTEELDKSLSTQAWIFSLLAVFLCTIPGIVCVILCIMAVRDNNRGDFIQANNLHRWARNGALIGIVIGGIIFASQLILMLRGVK